MKISARNQLKGTVKEINEGVVNGIVVIDIGGQNVSATISMSSIKELGLEVGKTAYAIVKSTEMMIAEDKMKISARNQFQGTITEVKEGAVNGIVKLNIGGGNHISATISMDSIKELGLAAGKEATAIVKATEVMMANVKLNISARNQLTGTVSAIEEGAVNAIVKLDVAEGVTISSTISMEAVKELGLAVGKEATAIIKATSVMIGA